MSETNNLLCTIQLLIDFIFIDNDNILGEHIWKDKIQLNNKGTVISANNIIKCVNRKHKNWHASPMSSSLCSENGDTHPNHIHTVKNQSKIEELCEDDPLRILKHIKLNKNRLIVGHININGIRNKFESLQMLIKNWNKIWRNLSPLHNVQYLSD